MTDRANRPEEKDSRYRKESPEGSKYENRRDKKDFVDKDAEFDRGGKSSKFKKRICRFCHDKAIPIDYKRTDVLVRFVSNKGKILPRRLTGNCAKHQRHVARSIKQSRMSGLLPFSVK
ncbi:MAG: 30S ribosomal protein S18 [Spirochaetia bacterium]|nr:30S ribosomal protein S18 [Spirochaetia bacterium]